MALFKGEREKYLKGTSKAASTEGAAKDILQVA